MEDTQEEEEDKALMEKRKATEWRKISKQLKAKDPATKLDAISRCRDDSFKPLSEGDCLAPLLQLCVPSKKNSKEEVIEQALAVVGDFVEDSSARSLVVRVAEKKKLSLFTDLFTRDNKTIVFRSLKAYDCLNSFSPDGATIRSLAAVLTRLGRHEADGDSGIILSIALNILAKFLRDEEGLRTDFVEVEDAIITLASCACSTSEFAQVAIELLAIVISTAGASEILLAKEEMIQAIIAKIFSSLTPTVLERDDLAQLLRILEQLLAAASDCSSYASTLGEAAEMLSKVLDFCVHSRQQDSGIDTQISRIAVATSRCLQLAVEVLGQETAGSCPKLLQLLLIAPGDDTSRIRFSLEKVLCHLCKREPLNIESIVAGLSIEDDDDARIRTVRFVEVVAAQNESNAKSLGESQATVENLLKIVDRWTTWQPPESATSNECSVDLDIGAALSCRALLRLMAVSTEARSSLSSQSALDTLDAALAANRGREAVAKVWDLSRVKWEDIKKDGPRSSPFNEVAVCALAADILANLATVSPTSENCDYTKIIVTAKSAETTLALAASDLIFDDTSTYWGRRRSTPLMSCDLHDSTMNLLGAIASSPKGREALLRTASSWTPPKFSGRPDSAEIEEKDASLFQCPELEGEPHRSWWPYAYVLTFPLSVLEDPSTTVLQQSAALRVIRCLTLDPNSPPSLQPLDIDRFAAQTIALGGLVTLCAISSTVTVSAYASCTDSAITQQLVEELASSAKRIAVCLIERGLAREARIEANAATCAARAYEECLEEEANRLQAVAAGVAAESKKATNKAVAAAKGKKGDKKAPPATKSLTDEVDENETLKLNALQEAETLLLAEKAGEGAAMAARADERGGPTRDQWVRLLQLSAIDRRRDAHHSPLLAALAGGETSCSSLVCSLLEANVGVKDWSENLPLAHALMRGSLVDATMLLEAGADKDAQDVDGIPMLQYGFIAPDHALLDAAITTRDASPLKAKGAFVAKLLEAGADADVADSEGKFPLHWAVEGISRTLVVDGLEVCSEFDLSKTAEIVSLLLEKGNARVDCCDINGETPLHSAVRLGRAAVASSLLSAGAHPNLFDRHRRLPLHVACTRLGMPGFPEIVSKLANAKRPLENAVFDNSRVGLSSEDKRRKTFAAALDAAYISAVFPAVVVGKIPESSELLTRQDDEGRTPLHCASGADYFDDLANSSPERRAAAAAELMSREDLSLKMLVIPCEAEEGATIAHLSIRTLKDAALPVLQALNAKSAPLNDLVCRPPMDAVHIPSALMEAPPPPPCPAAASPIVAAPTPAPAVAFTPAPAPAASSAIIQYRASTIRRVFAPIHYAIVADASKVVRWLIEEGASPSPAYCAPTPLALSAIVGASAETTVPIIEASETGEASKPCIDLGGVTAIHCAAALGHDALLEALLLNGEIDALDADGRTPLNVATRARQIASVKCLLNAGADVSIRDASGMAPLDVAIGLKSPLLANLILSCPHAEVAACYLLHAERVHIDAAKNAFEIPREKRDGSSQTEDLEATISILKSIQRACPFEQLSEHLDPCFAEGLLYSDVLQDKERARILENEQKAAATRIQTVQRRLQAKEVRKRLSKKSKRKAKRNRKR